MSMLEHKIHWPHRKDSWLKPFPITLPDFPKSLIWWPIMLHIAACSFALWWLS